MSHPAPQDSALPVTDHLEELRRRLIWCLAAVVVLAGFSYFFVDVFIAQMSGIVGPLVFLKPTEAFVTRLKLALILGVFFAIPVFIYHIWRFVGIALSVEERRVILGVLPFSYLLFACGAGLAWFQVVPTGLKFLMTFASAEVRPLISIQSCLEFAAWITIGMGLLFQIPVAVAALAKWGILTSAFLKEYRRHAVLGILVLAALLTPGPDVVSQLLLAVPTYLLFEISVLLATVLEPKV